MCRMYFWMVRLQTRIPSLSNSPRIRSAPQSRLFFAISLINAMVSGAIFTCVDVAFDFSFQKRRASLTMPLEKGLWLNNVEGLPPCPSYPCQKHEEEPISFRRAWPFDLSPKKNKLLAQEGILGHQFTFSPSEIHERFEQQ